MVILAEPTHCDPYAKEDRGCRGISRRCVDCHLPVCLEDLPGGIATLRMERTQVLVVGLRRLGWPAQEIANRLNVSRETVYRLLEDRPLGAKRRFTAEEIRERGLKSHRDWYARNLEEARAAALVRVRRFRERKAVLEGA